MKRTTIRELRHETTKILSMVEAGESVEVWRHSRLVAVLTPPEKKTSAQRPDFAGRLAKIYGQGVLGTTGTELVNELRWDR